MSCGQVDVGSMTEGALRLQRPFLFATTVVGMNADFIP